MMNPGKSAELVAQLAETTLAGQRMSYYVSDPGTRDTFPLVHALADGISQASKERLVPLVISPPKRFLDTGAVAVTQASVGLMKNGLANGPLSSALVAETTWHAKLEALKRDLRSHQERLVLLVDSPREWMLSNPDPSDAYFGEHTAEAAELFEFGVECSRIICGFGRYRPKERIVIDSTTADYQPWLNDEAHWGGLSPFAVKVWNRYKANLSRLGRMEVRLLVAAAAMQEGLPGDIREAAEIPAILIELLVKRPNSVELRQIWRRLAQVRGTFDDVLLATLSPDRLGQPYREMLYLCLLERTEAGWVLPAPLRRWNLFSFLSPAGLVEHDQEWHRHVAQWYRGQLIRHGGAATLAAPDYLPNLEAVFHGTAAADPWLVEHGEFFFPEQLNALGRALSRAKNYDSAVNAFRRSLKWDPDDDYANHYLAFNLDVRGLDRETVERHYRRAVELEPTHVWWWSRWICFLITLGRTSDAERLWGQSTEALGIPAEAESDVSTYFHLHAWVARLLLRRGQLEFAERVLKEIPEMAIAQDNAEILVTLKTLHCSLLEAQRSHAVFPVTVDPTSWWTWAQPPLVDLNPHHDGRPLNDWLPGRIDSLDDRGVHIVVGIRPTEDGGPAGTGDVTVTIEAFEKACTECNARAIEAGRFVILAFYGAEQELMIRLMPRVPLRLPHDELDPMRYLNQRWGSKA